MKTSHGSQKQQQQPQSSVAGGNLLRSAGDWGGEAVEGRGCGDVGPGSQYCNVGQHNTRVRGGEIWT